MENWIATMNKVLLVIGCLFVLLTVWVGTSMPISIESAVLAAGFAVGAGLTFIASAIYTYAAKANDRPSPDQRMQANSCSARVESESLIR